MQKNQVTQVLELAADILETIQPITGDRVWLQESVARLRRLSEKMSGVELSPDEKKTLFLQLRWADLRMMRILMIEQNAVIPDLLEVKPVNARQMLLAARVLTATIVEWEAIQLDGWDGASISAIAQKANVLIEAYGEGDHRSPLSSKLVGGIVRNVLCLETERMGKKRRYQVVWNPERISELREQFEISDADIEQAIEIIELEEAKNVTRN